jgi:hypothetical protein
MGGVMVSDTGGMWDGGRCQRRFGGSFMGLAVVICGFGGGYMGFGGSFMRFGGHYMRLGGGYMRLGGGYMRFSGSFMRLGGCSVEYWRLFYII